MNHQGVEGRVEINEIIIIVIDQHSPTKTKSIPAESRNNIPLSMSIEKVELMQECFPLLQTKKQRKKKSRKE